MTYGLCGICGHVTRGLDEHERHIDTHPSDVLRQEATEALARRLTPRRAA